MPTFCQLQTKSSTFWPWTARLESSEPVLPQVTSSLQMSLMYEVVLVRHQHLNCDEHTVLHNFDQNLSLKTKPCVGLVLLDVWTFLDSKTWQSKNEPPLWLINYDSMEQDFPKRQLNENGIHLARIVFDHFHCLLKQDCCTVHHNETESYLWCDWKFWPY